MKLLSITSWLIVALTLNVLTACGGSGGSPLNTGIDPQDDTISDGSGNDGSGNQPQPPAIIETDLEKALRSGDASLLDNNAILVDTALQTIAGRSDHFDAIKTALLWHRATSLNAAQLEPKP